MCRPRATAISRAPILVRTNLASCRFAESDQSFGLAVSFFMTRWLASVGGLFSGLQDDNSRRWRFRRSDLNTNCLRSGCQFLTPRPRLSMANTCRMGNRKRGGVQQAADAILKRAAYAPGICRWNTPTRPTAEKAPHPASKPLATVRNSECSIPTWRSASAITN